MELYFITGNSNKLKEIEAIIPGIKNLELDLSEIQSNSPQDIIEAKLNEANKIHPELELIVEDASLRMDALGGFPGTFVKSFLEKNSLIDIYNIAKDRNNYGAQAITVIGYKDKFGEKHYFTGVVNGKIIEPKVKTDFGWDPVFKPNGYDKSFGEMTSKEKNVVSMRGIAAEKLKKHYENNK